MAAGTKVQLRLGDRVVAEVAFRGDELRVGRMKENDLVINNLAVSRFHAVLRRVGDAFELEDLGSENGSFIDDIAVRGSALVPSGASITIGKHTLQIRDGAEGSMHPLPGRSDAWDAAQTYFAPELAPQAVELEEEDGVSEVMEAELVEEGVADVIEAIEPAPEPVAASAPEAAPRAAPQALELPDAEGLFAFGEDELVGQAAPDPEAVKAFDAVVEPAAAASAVPVAPAAEPGSQTALFDFGLADDLGLSDRSLARSAETRAAAPVPPEPELARPGHAEMLHAGLIVERHGKVERVVPCGTAELVVGRAPGCGIVLASAGVSRRHARFVRQGERLQVKDLGSANGIRVNGEPAKARTLSAGDVVGIDDYTLTYVLDREPVDGVVRASAQHRGDAEHHTVFAEAPAVAMPERDLVLETDDEDAPVDWEKELERAAELATDSAAPVRAELLEGEWVVEVAIATERLPAALRAALRELGEDELRLPAELRLSRRRPRG